MFKAALLLVVGVQLVTMSLAIKKCLRPPGVAISEAFLTETKFEIISHSLCDNCEEGEEGFSNAMMMKPLPKSLCWRIFGESPKGDFECNLQCKCHKPYEQVCDDVNSDDIIPMKGSLIITNTDNATYFGGAFCRFGQANLWVIASTESTLDKTSEDKVLATLKKHGFKTDAEQTKDHKVKFTSLEVSSGNC